MHDRNGVIRPRAKDETIMQLKGVRVVRDTCVLRRPALFYTTISLLLSCTFMMTKNSINQSMLRNDWMQLMSVSGPAGRDVYSA